MNTTGAEHRLPPLFPPSPAWLAARDDWLNHVMACPACVTHSQTLPRLCPKGMRLQCIYNSTPYTDEP